MELTRVEEQTVDAHLQQALAHLEAALEQSVRQISSNQVDKRTIGIQWEKFLGEFIGQVREKGKRSKVNLLALISFPRIR